MTNTINTVKNLTGVDAGMFRSIGCSAITLINAGIIANDRAEAAATARNIYTDSRGMWRAVQAKARRTLKVAEKNGLTVERPYLVKDRIVWGMLGDHLVPMCGAGVALSGPYHKLPA